MINKIIYFTLFLCSITYAEVQDVRIGTIDKHYENEISKSELKEILSDIEQIFESTLGFDVFNYSRIGKPIDILYMPPLHLEKKIEKQIVRLNKKELKIEVLESSLPDKQKRITDYQVNLDKFASHINTMTISLNTYIKNSNKRRDYSTAEYKNIQIFVEKKQSRIQREIKNLRKERRVLRRLTDGYNKDTRNLNNLVREYNHISKQISRMSRSIKKVKGKTFGFTEVSLKTYYKDGKKVKERRKKTSMSKIEIYSFESKEQLKAVLAHEIGHLVGIPHINVDNALMNPYLQDNQIKNLILIPEDIRNFKRNF
jgi:DNA repair exonuclease SbcCD ATPase subunit